MTEAEELELLELEAAEKGSSPQAAPSAGRATAMAAAGRAALDYGGRALDYAGGGVRTALMEAIERARSSGAKGIGDEAWKRAAVGKGKTFSEYMPETGLTNKDSYTNAIGGFAADTLTDPLSYLAAVSKVPGAIKGLNTWGSVGKAALLQSDPATLVQAPFQIAKGINALGRGVYRLPYSKVAKDMASYSDAARYAPFEAIDDMYNAGVKGTNQTLKDSFEARRTGAYDSYKNATEGYRADLAPSVTQGAVEHGKSTVTNYIDDQVKAMSKNLEDSGMDTVQAQNKALELRQQLEAKVADGDDFFVNMREGGEDAFKANLKNRLRGAIGGEANQRRKAVTELKDRLHSQFHPEVDKLVGKLDSSERNVALDSIDSLLNTGFSGEKDLAALDEIAAGYGMKASGSDAFGTNVYKASGKKETRKAVASNTSSNIKNVVEENMDPADVATYLAGKKEYGKYARSKNGFFDAIAKSEGTLPVSALDIAGGTLAAGGIATGEHDISPWALGALGFKNAYQNLKRFPAISSRVGQGIRSASKTNLWDNIAREGLAKALKDDEAQ